MKMRKINHVPNDGGPDYIFECPACGCSHGIWNKMPDGTHGWDFDGNMEHPTISPSIYVESGDEHGHTICHSFVKNGMIQYLSDCTHELAGKTIELSEI